MLQKEKKLLSIFEINLLIISIVSLGFFIGEINLVNANEFAFGIKDPASYPKDPSALLAKTSGGQAGAMAGAGKEISSALKSATTPQGPLGKFLSPTSASSPFFNNLWVGAQWALAAYGVVQLVAPMLGLEQSTTDALSAGAAAGFGN